MRRRLASHCLSSKLSAAPVWAVRPVAPSESGRSSMQAMLGVTSGPRWQNKAWRPNANINGMLSRTKALHSVGPAEYRSAGFRGGCRHRLRPCRQRRRAWLPGIHERNAIESGCFIVGPNPSIEGDVHKPASPACGRPSSQTLGLRVREEKCSTKVTLSRSNCTRSVSGQMRGPAPVLGKRVAVAQGKCL